MGEEVLVPAIIVSLLIESNYSNLYMMSVSVSDVKCRL